MSDLSKIIDALGKLSSRLKKLEVKTVSGLDPLRLLDGSSLTISSDQITITRSFHILIAETGAVDDLSTIQGGIEGQVLAVKVDTGMTITVKHGLGNIELNGAADQAISGEQTLVLFYDGDTWTDIAFGGGGGASALDDLTDVVITAPIADNEVLAYDSGSGDWINQTAVEAGLSEPGHTHLEVDVTDLDHDAVKLQGRDISVAAPNDADVLTWDNLASEWTPVAPTGGTDPDAIHVNVAGEIAAIAEKISPVNADKIVIEDSEDSDNKKMVQLGNIAIGSSPQWITASLTWMVGASTITLDAASWAQYIHIGKLVILKAHLVADSNGSGVFEVSGIPLSIVNYDTQALGFGKWVNQGTNFYNMQVKGMSSSVIRFTRYDTYQELNDTVTGAESDSIDFTIIYETNTDGPIGSGDSTYTDIYANRPAASNDGNLFFPSDGFVVERDTGAAWVPWGPLFPLIAPIIGDFSWINQGGATLDTSKGGMIIEAPASTTNLRIQKKPAPGTPYTIDMLFQLRLMGTNYPHAGFCWRESSSGKLVSIDIVIDTNIPKFQSNKWNSPTSYNSTYSNVIDAMVGQMLWIRITDDGVTRKGYTSSDGQHWIEIFSQGHTDFMTPDEVGFYMDTNNSGYAQSITLLHWKES